MNKIIYSLDKNKSYIIAFLIITECIFLFFTYKSFNDRVETIDKTSVVKKEKYSMYIKDGNNYVAYNATNTFPEGYVLNLTESYCVDGNDTRVNNAITKTDDKVTVTSNQTLFCTLYFDQDMHFASQLRNLCSTDNTIVAYSGKVTDDISQIGTGVDATKVCAFTSNTNNNVVFANHCWQIRRTTETGGVKIQYNGEPTLGTNNGETTYDCGTERPYHVGDIRTTQDLNGTKTYGNGYTTSVSGSTTTFTLTDTSSVTVANATADSDILSLKGKYICGTGSTTTCTNADLKKIGEQSSGTSAYVYASTYRDSVATAPFNSNRTSPADFGYMYNQRYAGSQTYISGSVTMLSSVTLSSYYLTNHGDYYFGDDYNLSGNNHVLTNAVKGNTITGYPSAWKGMYECTTSTSCSTAYYISGIDTSGTNPIMYRATIASGKEYNDSQYKYLIGEGLQDNGDGTFSLTGTIREIIQKDWYDTYSSITAGMYVCMPGYYIYNSSTGVNTCSDNGTTNNVNAIGYITNATVTTLSYSPVYKYGYGIEADNGNYTLTAKDEEPQTLQYITNWPSTSTTNCFANDTTKISSCGYKTLSKSHYTCYNLSGICSTYYYINHSSINPSSTYSIPISGGKYVSTDLTDTNNVLYEMLNASNLNTTDSTIKGVIDTWYQDNLLNTSFESLIDTSAIYCNDRRIRSYGGWNPDGGTTDAGYLLQFTYTSTSNLVCGRSLDAFSTSNSSAHLNYSIGLMSALEMYILGNNTVRGSAYYYWLSSPDYFERDVAVMSSIQTTGYFSSGGVQTSRGVRPAIVLNSNAEIASGTGSTSDPWVIAGSEMTVTP